MNKALKTQGKSGANLLIENQLHRLSIARPSKYSRARQPPRGGALPLVSIPLCVTPFNILALPEVQK